MVSQLAYSLLKFKYNYTISNITIILINNITMGYLLKAAVHRGSFPTNEHPVVSEPQWGHRGAAQVRDQLPRLLGQPDQYKSIRLLSQPDQYKSIQINTPKC